MFLSVDTEAFSKTTFWNEVIKSKLISYCAMITDEPWSPENNDFEIWNLW